MAHFRGVLDNGETSVTSRLGSGRSPFEVTSQSYEGEVNVRMWKGKNGHDMVEITVRSHKTDLLNKYSRIIYHGPVRDMRHIPEVTSEIGGK